MEIINIDNIYYGFITRIIFENVSPLFYAYIPVEFLSRPTQIL